jgi:hypothetical protein
VNSNETYDSKTLWREAPCGEHEISGIFCFKRGAEARWGAWENNIKIYFKETGCYIFDWKSERTPTAYFANRIITGDGCVPECCTVYSGKY